MPFINEKPNTEASILYVGFDESNGGSKSELWEGTDANAYDSAMKLYRQRKAQEGYGTREDRQAVKSVPTKASEVVESFNMSNISNNCFPKSVSYNTVQDIEKIRHKLQPSMGSVDGLLVLATKGNNQPTFLSRFAPYLESEDEVIGCSTLVSPKVMYRGLPEANIGSWEKAQKTVKALQDEYLAAGSDEVPITTEENVSTASGNSRFFASSSVAKEICKSNDKYKGFDVVTIGEDCFAEFDPHENKVTATGISV